MASRELQSDVLETFYIFAYIQIYKSKPKADITI
jgi:hypothetical protein